jgi:hypothetical protein
VSLVHERSSSVVNFCEERMEVRFVDRCVLILRDFGIELGLVVYF